MIQYTFLYIGLICSMYSVGQDTSVCEKDSGFVTMTALDSTPCYNKGCKGLGEHDMLKFIQKEMNYPESARQDLIEGKVYINYIVEKDGSTSQHEILKGVRDDIDKEALRISKLS